MFSLADVGLEKFYSLPHLGDDVHAEGAALHADAALGARRRLDREAGIPGFQFVGDAVPRLVHVPDDPAYFYALGARKTVVAVDALACQAVVEIGNEQLVEMEGRPWTFAQEQGFVAAEDDQVTLTGFYEDGEFEVGKLENQTSGLLVLIREDSGRPLWAGGGRRGL